MKEKIITHLVHGGLGFWAGTVIGFVFLVIKASVACLAP